MEGSTLVPAYDVFREGVRASLPEIDEISDPELRDKVEGAWAMALAETEFASIDEVRPSGNPDTPAMKSGTQADHLRGVTRMAVALADSFDEEQGDPAPEGVEVSDRSGASFRLGGGRPRAIGIDGQERVPVIGDHQDEAPIVDSEFVEAMQEREESGQ